MRARVERRGSHVTEERRKQGGLHRMCICSAPSAKLARRSNFESRILSHPYFEHIAGSQTQLFEHHIKHYHTWAASGAPKSVVQAIFWPHCPSNAFISNTEAMHFTIRWPLQTLARDSFSRPSTILLIIFPSRSQTTPRR